MKIVNVALAILVSLLIAALVLEGGLRLLGLGPPDTGLRFDPQLGWSLEPNDSFRNESRAGEFDVRIVTDAQGLRDDFTDDLAKPKGVFRVLCLGDSFTLGYTCAREDLFVDLLETWWRAEGRQIEVVNAGVQGYSTDQQVRWLAERGLAFEPDLVLLFPYENDLYWNTQGSYAGSTKPLYDDRGQLATPDDLEDTARRTALERTALGNWLLHETPAPPRYTPPGAERPILAEHAPLLVEPPSFVLDAQRRTQGVLTAARSLSLQHGFGLVACPLPSHSQVDPAYAAEVMGPKILRLPRDRWDPALPYARLIDATTSRIGPPLDPLDALRAAQADAPQYHRVDWHLSPAGNRTLARFLHDALDERALVPPRVQESVLAPVAAVDARGGLPGWLPWFAGLWLALGTLYVRTYRDEPAPLAALKVGGLLATVFTIALGGAHLIGLLPPRASLIALVAVLLTILGFVAYKLGDRLGTAAELLKAFTLRGHWYLMPLLSILVTIGSLLVVAASSPLVAPFIYTLF